MVLQPHGCTLHTLPFFPLLRTVRAPFCHLSRCASGFFYALKIFWFFSPFVCPVWFAFMVCNKFGYGLNSGLASALSFIFRFGSFSSLSLYSLPGAHFSHAFCSFIILSVVFVHKDTLRFFGLFFVSSFLFTRVLALFRCYLDFRSFSCGWFVLTLLLPYFQFRLQHILHTFIAARSSPFTSPR